MAKSSVQTGAIVILILLIIPSLGYSQETQPSEFRNISLTINGGMTLGDMNKGNYFMSSNFSVNTKETPTFGVGIQYALTPIWSFDLGYRHAQIQGLDTIFETDLNQLSLKSLVNLNQLFSVNRVMPRVNPFISAGVGYDFYRYNDPEATFRANNTSYNAGFGVAYKLTNTFDLVAQYEYHMGSNAIDNVREGFQADFMNTVTAGIRLNIGKKETMLSSWREPPVDLSRAEYDRIVKQGDHLYELQERVDRVEQQTAETDSLTVKLDQQSAALDSLAARFALMNNRVSNLRQVLSQLQVATNCIEVDDNTGFTASLPQGFYVQIYATTQLHQAQEMRSLTLNSISEVLDHADEKVFIIHRKAFYEVFIGLFNEYSHAREVQQRMKRLQDDAYVISFPRASSLQNDFEGLQVIDETGTVITMSD